MNIHGYIVNTLEPTNVPTSLRTHNGSASEYITYFTEEYPELNADDEESIVGFFVQLNVYSAGNYNVLVNQVADLMKNAGFEKLSFRDDPYSPQTNMYHKVMTFSYSAPSAN